MNALTATAGISATAVQPLLTPVQVGPYRLRNRIVMAPLTRMRAGAGGIPQPMNGLYYRQRASAGLVISEATPIGDGAMGYIHQPGIFTEAQVEGWKQVTEAVHTEGGTIFLQLFHPGRMSHPLLLNGELPVAPSALGSGESSPTAAGMQPHPLPRALATEEIAGIIADYAHAARLAGAAGFDGVEIHAANSYLIEQFLHDGSNRRTDYYGGSIANRTRFLIEVTEAVIEVWKAERVGVRLSPSNTRGSMGDSDRWALYAHVVSELNFRQPAYIHLVEPRVSGNFDVEPEFDLGAGRFRPLVTGQTKLISAGGHSQMSGNRIIEKGEADLVAFGRSFLANPDLPRRFALDAPLNDYDRPTFYGGTEKGYIDYPFLSDVPRLEG